VFNGTTSMFNFESKTPNSGHVLTDLVWGLSYNQKGIMRTTINSNQKTKFLCDMLHVVYRINSIFSFPVWVQDSEFSRRLQDSLSHSKGPLEMTHKNLGCVFLNYVGVIHLCFEVAKQQLKQKNHLFLCWSAYFTKQPGLALSRMHLVEYTKLLDHRLQDTKIIFGMPKSLEQFQTTEYITKLQVL
jgi:hypothetical protein